MAKLWKPFSKNQKQFNMIFSFFIILFICLIIVFFLYLKNLYINSYYLFPTVFLYIIFLFLLVLNFIFFKKLFLLHYKVKGERLVKTALMQLNDDYIIFCDISFRIKYHDNFISYLIISPGGIYNIEPIYKKGILAINDKNNLVFYNKNQKMENKKRIFNTLRRNKENLFLLLKEYMPTNKIPVIENIVTYTNADRVFNENELSIPVIDYKNLSSYIKKKKEKEKKVDINEIARMIINQDKNFHYLRKNN
ncbi:MAG: nuclease-related domain-containing protein [archaeon]